MPNALLAPPLTPVKELAGALCTDGYVVASAESVAEISGLSLGDLQGLTPFWEGLPRDP